MNLKLSQRNAEVWGVVITLIGITVGGVLWLSEMQILAKNNKLQIEQLAEDHKEEKRDMERKLDKQTAKISEQSNRIASLTTKIDMLIDIVKEAKKEKSHR